MLRRTATRSAAVGAARPAYERVAIDVFDGATLTPEFERLNPHRSTPVLELVDGRTLFESNAIFWYLAAGTPLLPADPYAQAEYATG